MSCPISWSIITKRETTKARTIFCFFPSLLCKIAMRHVRSAVESGSAAYSNITAVSHEYFGLTGIHLDATLRQNLRDVFIGQWISQVPTHAQNDHLTRVVTSF